MESLEQRIARRICELLGVPCPSEDARQMRQIVKEEIDKSNETKKNLVEKD